MSFTNLWPGLAGLADDLSSVHFWAASGTTGVMVCDIFGAFFSSHNDDKPDWKVNSRLKLKKLKGDHLAPTIVGIMIHATFKSQLVVASQDVYLHDSH